MQRSTMVGAFAIVITVVTNYSGFGAGLTCATCPEEQVAPAIPWRLRLSGLGHSRNGKKHLSTAT